MVGNSCSRAFKGTGSRQHLAAIRTARQLGNADEGGEGWRNGGNRRCGDGTFFLSGVDPAGYLGCCAAIRDFDSRDSLSKIRIPTLVIVGNRDVSTPWEGHG